MMRIKMIDSLMTIAKVSRINVWSNHGYKNVQKIKKTSI